MFANVTRELPWKKCQRILSQFKFEKIIMQEAEHNGRRFVIEYDSPQVGAYLYIYENGKCVADYLQNDIDICKEQAFEDYGVSLSSWRNIQSLEDI